ncbi:hypothetical protein [Spartinivicinus poritis]|uniref:Lipoprotein n=1 Tax=Spartinivicinus poritis TaxID=2994640 RepID=A0ABT5UA90_9GAMM|nr:hypothetical protein [Spartinivicinus sp. A2-2]MDE1463294.1 hypothetical protein [Spartinivicinus sp. A2-2]
MKKMLIFLIIFIFSINGCNESSIKLSEVKKQSFDEQYKIAEQAWQQQDHELVLDILHHLASKKYPPALLRLTDLYEYHDKINLSFFSKYQWPPKAPLLEACTWSLKAAHLGNEEGIDRVIDFVEKNLIESNKKYFSYYLRYKMAENGHYAGFLAIGSTFSGSKMLSSMIGYHEKNIDKEIYWHKLSALKGSKKAFYFIAFSYKHEKKELVTGNAWFWLGEQQSDYESKSAFSAYKSRVTKEEAEKTIKLAKRIWQDLNENKEALVSEGIKKVKEKLAEPEMQELEKYFYGLKSCEDLAK